MNDFDFDDYVIDEDLNLTDEEVMDLIYNDRYNEELLNLFLGK